MGCRDVQVNTHTQPPSEWIDHTGPVYCLERCNLTSTWPLVLCVCVCLCACVITASFCDDSVSFSAPPGLEEMVQCNIAASPQERWPLLS